MNIEHVEAAILENLKEVCPADVKRMEEEGILTEYVASKVGEYNLLVRRTLEEKPDEDPEVLAEEVLKCRILMQVE